MSDDRDLDELLESLDALLREGESHNDDAVGDDVPEVTAPVSGAAEEPLVEAVMAQSEASKEVQEEANTPEEARETEEESEADGSGDEALPHFLTEESEIDVDESPTIASADEEEAEEPSSSTPVNRVVLTEDMLVDNHQERLPLEQTAPGEAKTSEPVASGDKSAPFNEEQMRQLAALVRRDITLQLQAKLPQWIEQSINRHLRTESDQTKEQK